MQLPYLYKRVIGIALFVGCGVIMGPIAKAQVPANELLWKKRISRLVYVQEPVQKKDKGHRVKEAGLYDMLASAAIAGKVHVYSNFDSRLTDELILPEQNAASNGANSNLKAEHISKFRVMEDWSFNPYTLTTEVDIEGIAPVRDIFNVDGSYRASQSMFWFRYKDVKELLLKYEEQHPEHNLYTGIWNSHFADSTDKYIVKFTGKKTRAEQTARVVQTIDMQESGDGVREGLRDEDTGKSFPLMVTDEIQAGKIKAMSNHDFEPSTALTFSMLDSIMTRQADTIRSIDPVTNQETRVIQNYDYINHVYEYCISENVMFDHKTGHTTMQVTGIAPVLYEEGGDTVKEKFMIFWVSYDDVKHLLNLYNTYHQQNAFVRQIWDRYFNVPESSSASHQK